MIEDSDDGKLSAEKQKEICDRARKRFEICLSAASQNHSDALEDWKFRDGDQWDDYAKRVRGVRPMLTINKSNTFIHQITNDQRQNSPGIAISPKGAGKKTAQMYQGYVRAVERDSQADVAYDTGFEWAVTCGFGYWRVLAEFDGDLSMNQVLRVKPIRNGFTVYRDPARQQPVGSDSMFDFITNMIPTEEFKQQYPDAQPLGWQEGGTGDNYKGQWGNEQQVRIAEYFEVETKMRRLVELQNGHVGYFDDLDVGIKQQLVQNPSLIVDDREAECRHVMWYKITATEVLKSRKIPIPWIPIIECVGDVFDIEGKVIRRGMMRDFKGPQRIYNYSSTAIIEVTALQTKAPFVSATGQITAKNKARWDASNQENFPYLEYDPVTVDGTLAPAPHREPPPMISPAWLQIQSNAAQDMMAVTGVRFDSTLAERTADESGIALQRLALHQQLGSYHYLDNFRRAKEFTARIMVAWIPKLIHKRREVISVNDDGTEKMVVIDPTAPKSFQLETLKDGKKVEVYNLNIGQFEVTATIGPSYATKQQESTSGMMEFAKSFPNKADFVADLVAKEQPWECSDEVARRIAMTQPPGMIVPDETDMDPQVRALLQQQQMQMQQMQQQMQAMGQALQEKQSELALKSAELDIKQDKNNKDYEVDLLTIAEKMGNNIIEHLKAEVQSIRELEVAKIQGNGAAGEPQMTGEASD